VIISQKRTDIALFYPAFDMRKCTDNEQPTSSFGTWKDNQNTNCQQQARTEHHRDEETFSAGLAPNSTEIVCGHHNIPPIRREIHSSRISCISFGPKI
jgi:hypothetical protein